MNGIQTPEEQIQARRQRAAELASSPRIDTNEKRIDLEINKLIGKQLDNGIENLSFGIIAPYLEFISNEEDKTFIKNLPKQTYEKNLAELEYDTRVGIIGVLSSRVGKLKQKNVFITEKEKESFDEEKIKIDIIIDYINSIDSDNSSW